MPSLTVAEEDVRRAIASFPNGSAGGPDGLRLQHLKDLTGAAAHEGGCGLTESPHGIGKSHPEGLDTEADTTLPLWGIISCPKEEGWRGKTHSSGMHVTEVGCKVW